MKKIHPNQITPELQDTRILKGVKSLFDDLKKHLQPKEPTVLMTRQEVADFLKVDISSVHNYTKRGILKSFGNQGRVYYMRSQVEEILKPLNV